MLRIILGFALVAMLAMGTASAGCTNIESSGVSIATLDANAGNCLIVGDKQFFNFSFQPELSTIDPNSLFVSTFGTGAAGDPFGVQFTGPFGLNNSAGSSLKTFDFALGYNVVATGGLISSISNLIAAGCSNVNGCTTDADVNVVEIAHDPVSNQTANSTVDLNVNDLTDPPAEKGDNLTFGTPVTGATITKDVSVTAGVGDIINFSIIKQDFEQVPEPRAYALVLGLGFAFLLWRKRAAASA